MRNSSVIAEKNTVSCGYLILGTNDACKCFFLRTFLVMTHFSAFLNGTFERVLVRNGNGDDDVGFFVKKSSTYAQG